MEGDGPVNLRRARKRKQRAERARSAEASRAREGETKAERETRARESALRARRLEGLKREPD